MNNQLNLIYSFSLLLGILTFILSLFQLNKGKGIKSIFLPSEIQGSFVWADGLIFGLFWFLVSLGFLIYKPEDWRWFVIFFLVFWFIRSTGETIYWFLQQFLPRKQGSPNFLKLKKFCHQDEYMASFIYQIFWQSVSVVCLFGLIWLLWQIF